MFHAQETKPDSGAEGSLVTAQSVYGWKGQYSRGKSEKSGGWRWRRPVAGRHVAPAFCGRRLARGALPIALATGMAVSSCSAPPSTAELAVPESSTSRAGVTEASVPVANPPTTVPRVRILNLSGATGTVGEVVYQNWIKQGRQHEFERDGISSNLEAVRITTAEPLHFDLGTAVRPLHAQAIGYAELDSDLKPVGRTYSVECTVQRQAPCSITSGSETGVRLHVRMPIDARLVIINVGWYVPTALREHDSTLSPEVSASWAFIIQTR